VGAGAVAVAVEPGVAPAAQEQVVALFRLLGFVEVLPEELFDVVTAVSGSSPAFFALAVEGLEDGAVAAGMSRADARRVVRQATLETARQLADHSDSPAEIRRHLVSTGQLAPETLELLEGRKLRFAFRDAVAAAMERSRQMRNV
jgi:pyrroline-5-carboxylate reductase